MEKEQELKIALKKMKDAWEIAGVNPQYHLSQINRLKEEWATLYYAIENLLLKIKEE